MFRNLLASEKSTVQCLHPAKYNVLWIIFTHHLVALAYWNTCLQIRQSVILWNFSECHLYIIFDKYLLVLYFDILFLSIFNIVTSMALSLMKNISSNKKYIFLVPLKTKTYLKQGTQLCILKEKLVEKLPTLLVIRRNQYL